MKSGATLSSVIFAGLLAWQMQPAHALSGQAFAGAAAAPALEGGAMALGTPDGMVFAEGTRAINEGRWAEAIAIFTRIAAQKSDHADGALYWRAYAENKMGQTGAALDSCAALRASYVKSSWVDECGALEIEIRARNGQPVQPKPDQSDDLRLLALNSLMQHDPEKARGEIEEILNDEDTSGRLKNGALFLLGQQRANVSYPETVRISYAEGDVRIARRRENEKNGAAWEKAETNTPIETGFSLVTGAGRAEIEFENASTIYLDENSVLTFNDLHTTDSVPYSEVALLSGTVTLHVKPYIAGEVFLLKTPTDDNLITTYPHSVYMRVTSYLDATALTPQQGSVLRLPGTSEATVVGQTMYYHTQRRLEPSEVNVSQSYTDWDRWVSGRVESRTKATNEAMEEAGLTAPLPGLAEMRGQGRFFDCAPYGTCWEPAAAEQWEAQNGGQEDEARGAVQTANESSEPAASASASSAAKAAKFMSSTPSNAATNPSRSLAEYEFFPCAPQETQAGMMTATAAVHSSLDAIPYQWGVCHSGYWIRHQRHYVWVVGKRHHHPPYRWVKTGKTVGIVPIHPKDVKGELPVNAKERLIAMNPKTGVPEGPVKFDPHHPIALMKDPPREFRSEPMPMLARAEEPHAVAHSVKDAGAAKELGGNRIGVAHGGVPITFDAKSQSFLVARQEMHSGHTVTVNAPISNHNGNLQSHGASFGGGGGSHSGGAGGGGSHGGGSSGGSSGGSHGGSSGGGGSSSGSSAGSSGGGSHH